MTITCLHFHARAPVLRHNGPCHVHVQINRLYRPLTGSSSSINLASDSDSLSDDEFGAYESSSGSQLLPTHHSSRTGAVRLPLTPKTAGPAATNANAVVGGGGVGGVGNGNGKAGGGKGSRRGEVALMDVWDEREELFGVGDESDEEMEIIQGSPSHPHHPHPPPPHDRELLDESAGKGTGKGTGARGKAASNSRHVRFEEEEDEDEELGR